MRQYQADNRHTRYGSQITRKSVIISSVSQARDCSEGNSFMLSDSHPEASQPCCRQLALGPGLGVGSGSMGISGVEVHARR